MVGSAFSNTQIWFVFCHKKGVLRYAEDCRQGLSCKRKHQCNCLTTAVNANEEINVFYREMYLHVYEDTSSFLHKAFFLLLLKKKKKEERLLMFEMSALCILSS